MATHHQLFSVTWTSHACACGRRARNTVDPGPHEWQGKLESSRVHCARCSVPCTSPLSSHNSPEADPGERDSIDTEVPSPQTPPLPLPVALPVRLRAAGASRTSTVKETRFSSTISSGGTSFGVDATCRNPLKSCGREKVAVTRTLSPKKARSPAGQSSPSSEHGSVCQFSWQFVCVCVCVCGN